MATSSEMTNGVVKEETMDPLAEDDNDDDPIIHEVPVFLAKSLAESLFVFQHPVRPAKMPYDLSHVVSSKVRPRQQQVEITVGMDTQSPNFDHSKGEQIALNVDGSGQGRGGGGGAKAHKVDMDDMDNKVFPSGLMDKFVLSSTKAVNNPSSRYAVGILGGNELHLTPIKGIVSLRPNLNYLDKSDKTAKQEGRTLDDDPIEVDQDEVKQVTVRFAKGDQESAKRMKEKSFEYQQRKAEEEAWIPTQFHPVKSAKWEEESQNLFCKRMDEEVLCAGSLSVTEYLHSLTQS